jgi:hypothetical protein
VYAALLIFIYLNSKDGCARDILPNLGWISVLPNVKYPILATDVVHERCLYVPKEYKYVPYRKHLRPSVVRG